MLPEIETERLILRPPKLGDEKPLNQAINRSLPELQRWMPWAKDPSLQPTIRYVKAGIASWGSDAPRDCPMVIVHKASQQIMGASGFNDRSKPEVPMFEIAYWLETAFTGQGMATEMVQALTHFAFESFKAARVQIVIQVGNEASRRVAEKCGFILEATLKNYCVDPLSGKPSDDWIFVCCSTGVDHGN
ncbi:MAG: GNAT family N-acetyltransferase [Methylococcales bacterium]|nr:GNAT family N-acetyltransferase [Methylococcales bacterium]